jgi:hypothetical protein
MGYADGLLTTGEHVVHREKQHWWVFVWGARYTILAIVIALVFFVLGGSLDPGGVSGTARMILGWITAILFIGGIAVAIWTTLRYFNQEYVLTNRRIIETEGVVNKRSADSSLEKINDAVLEQSVFGRVFGFGDLKVLTASDSAISEFKMLRRPIEFKKAMLEAKHEYEIDVAGGREADAPPIRATPVAPASAAPAAPVAVGDETVAGPGPGAPAPAATDADDLTRTLASLADLRDRGAITPEEYERKKADLLSRI